MIATKVTEMISIPLRLYERFLLWSSCMDCVLRGRDTSTSETQREHDLGRQLKAAVGQLTLTVSTHFRLRTSMELVGPLL